VWALARQLIYKQKKYLIYYTPFQTVFGPLMDYFQYGGKKRAPLPGPAIFRLLSDQLHQFLQHLIARGDYPGVGLVTSLRGDHAGELGG
jgi:hypothetical protein